MQRIKSGDTVQVISGNEKGARGEVKEIVRSYRLDRQKHKIHNPNDDRVIVATVIFAKSISVPSAKLVLKPVLLNGKPRFIFLMLCWFVLIVMRQYGLGLILKGIRRCAFVNVAAGLSINNKLLANV